MLKKYIAIILILSLLISIVSPVGAIGVDSFNVTESDENISDELPWEEKISKVLLEKIESADQNEKIPVWIWFADIDHAEIREKVEKLRLDKIVLTSEISELNYKRKNIIKMLNSTLKNINCIVKNNISKMNTEMYKH